MSGIRIGSWAFSSTRFERVWGRLLLSVFVSALISAGPNFERKSQVLLAAGVYALLNMSAGFVRPASLRRARAALLFVAVDIIFVSAVVYYTGGAYDWWFIFYTFPIISTARHFGYRGSLLVASAVTLGYTVLSYLALPQGVNDPYTTLVRCAFLLGVALVASNISQAREREASGLVRNFEEINSEMLSDVSAEKAFQLILRQALEMTRSEAGHIRLANGTTPSAGLKLVASVGRPPTDKDDLTPLDESFSRKAFLSKKPLLVPSIGNKFLRQHLAPYFRLYHPRPKSALFVPICIKDEAIGVIAVYSRKHFHYTEIDSKRLASFGLLVAVAQANAELYRQLSASAAEKQGRLELLHNIGEALTAGSSLSDLFSAVVGLTYSRLNSEEAALFLADPSDSGRIVKVAVRGPNEEVTSAAGSFEMSYRMNESLVGAIFHYQSPVLLNAVPADVDYVSDYERILPSRLVRHFIGVPLRIGEEVFGVLRVINKKSPHYSAEAGVYTLLDEGFGAEDVALLETIASQIAVAIKNQQLLKSEKLAVMGQLAHTVGHDIKTDIATALNYVNVLSFSVQDLDEPSMQEMYGGIKNALGNAVERLQALLMVSRPRHPVMVETDAATLLEGVSKQMSLLASTRKINFSVAVPADPCPLMVDPDQMRQVFSNLFSNSEHAIHVRRSTNAGGDAGSIRVSAEVCDGRLQIVWEDDGCGIPGQDLARLFDAFFTTKPSGNGLGLYLTKTIVDNHGGSISVASLEGERTRFEITLPTLRRDVGSTSST